MNRNMQRVVPCNVLNNGTFSSGKLDVLTANSWIRERRDFESSKMTSSFKVNESSSRNFAVKYFAVPSQLTLATGKLSFF